MITIGETNIVKAYLGQTELKNIAIGDELLLGSEPLPYLKFTALENGTFKHTTNALEYSLDEGRTWVALSANTDTPTIHTGESVCWRGTISPSSAVRNFSSTGYFDASGDPRSIIYSSDFSDKPLKNYCFNGLFSDCSKLVNAKDILLPTLVFANRNEYARMFQNCTSLISAPALPATTLTNYCYYYMFLGCTSLATAPALPATTLETACYRSMFEGCTSLATAPELLATTLCDQCYNSLFKNCSSLTYIKALFVDITGTNPLYSWVQGVASNGTFVKASGATIPSGNNGIPNNWTVQEV